ncbi:MAG: DUF3488 domain-containing protein [Planctomicrobium sp.]|jgi:protein-glutamine gamma-glutamyltransferase|nr:DUF3488 domain-containing protein [Planctomicrobium sp.]
MKTILFFSLTAMISLSGIIFAVAEGSPLAGCSLLIALATLFFVDIEEKFSVPPVVANLFGFVAFLIAGLEFFNGEIESRLLAGGHLIVYLTWVFMIQKKETRHIWWLCALSILQIATASVLTKSIWFGGALIVYSFLATWTLSVFLLYRSTRGSSLKSQNELEKDDLDSKFVVGDQWRGISRDVDHRLLNWRFLVVSCTMTCLGLCLTLMFFLFTPRIWIGQFSFLSDEAMDGRPLTGFTEEVKLGDMGEILENDEVVMELALSHTATELPFTEAEVWSTLGAEPLFRGTVMEKYENGRWKQLPNDNFQRFSRRNRYAPITQRYKISPIGSAALFSFGDTAYARAITDDRRVFRQQFSDEIIRDDEAPLNQPFEYFVRSNEAAFDSTFSTQRNYWSRFSQLQFIGGYQQTLRQIPDGMDRVIALSREITRDVSSNLDKAKLLENYFLNSSEFTYSLDLRIEDASVDPIEDFLFNRKSGHCEYYASSLAIMLRSVGIPSRLVSGFKGGQYDKNLNLFLVQQLHAHSWVEAYIDGSWVVLDSTPATRAESVQEQMKPTSSFAAIKQKFETAWNTGIQLSKTQQQQIIYKPIQEIGQQSWANAKNLMQGRATSFKSLLNFLTSPGEWFSIKGGFFVFVLLALTSGAIWTFRRIYRLIHGINFRSQKTTQRIQKVDFYRRFLKILRRQGIQQAPTQTAKEFVATSLTDLQPKLLKNNLEEWPADLVNKFYLVRYGERELSKADAEEIHRRLNDLENCLTQQEDEEK